MENASKALLMAGEVLLGIIVVSLLMIMVNSLTSYQQVNTQNQREAQIVQFNNQFEGYNRERVRGNEVYSLISKVIDYNKRKSDLGKGLDEEGQDSGFQPMKLTINFNNMTNKFSMDSSTSVIFSDYERKNMVIDGSRINNSLAEDMKRFNDQIPDAIDQINELVKGVTLPKFEGSTTVIKFSEKNLEKLVDSYDLLFNYKTETLPNSIADFNKRNKEDSDKVNVLDTFNNAIGATFFEIYRDNNNRIDVKINGSNATNYWSKYLTKQSIENCSNGKNIWENVNLFYEYSQFLRGIFECTKFEYNHDTGRVVEIEFKFTGRFD